MYMYIDTIDTESSYSIRKRSDECEFKFWKNMSLKEKWQLTCTAELK